MYGLVSPERHYDVTTTTVMTLTMKFPRMSVGRKTTIHSSPLARIQSHSGSIHSPHSTRKMSTSDCQKLLKFHLVDNVREKVVNLIEAIVMIRSVRI